MAPTKRKEPVKDVPVKKAKKDLVADKVVSQQLKHIADALKMAPIADEVKAMLTEVLPSSLGEFSDKRHKFQGHVVEALSGVLDGVEVQLKKVAAETRSQYEEATSSKSERDQEVTEAEAQVEAAKAETHALKVALAQKAFAFRSAQHCVKDAEEEKTLDGQKSQEASKKKGHFESAAEEFKTLLTLSPEEAQTRKKLNELVSLLKKHKFEESMLIALPAALAKAPDARGQFDLMAITQLEAEIAKTIAGEEAILEAAKPGQEQCEAAVQEAHKLMNNTRSDQREAAKKFDIASENQVAFEDAFNAAQSAVHSLLKSSEHLKKAVYAAEVEVELFQQGPKESFEALRSKNAPAPTVEEPMTDAQEALASEVVVC